MAHTYVVFARGSEQKRVRATVTRVIEQYPTFLLVEATDDQVNRLRAAGFVVEPRAEPTIPSLTLGDEQPEPPPGRHHFIVIFQGPVRPEWIQALTNLGGVVREPIPPYGYVVELDTAVVDEVRALPFVTDVTWYHPTRRIAADVTEVLSPPPSPPTPRPPHIAAEGREEEAEPFAAAETEEEAPIPPPPEQPRGLPELQYRVVRVVFYTRDTRDAAAQALEAEGATVQHPGEDNETDLLLLLPEDEAEARQLLQRVARLHGVQAVVPVVLPGTNNDVAGSLLGTTVVDTHPNPLPVTGRGEIVGVADSGLDTGSLANLHPDLQGQVVAIVSWPVSRDYWVNNPGEDDGPADNHSGHGTHVVGSIVGTGKAARERGLPPPQGTAPGAKVFFQAVQQRTVFPDGRVAFAFTGFPSDVRRLLRQAYDAGARVYNLSIALSPRGQYDVAAQRIDDFVWRHPDMTVVVAAGNAGADRDGDGRVDLGSVTSPGTAKNVITVGASENVRLSVGLTAPYGLLWPADFPAPPLRDDHPSDNPDHIAAFSGRGPTDDGRIKPDVVAPGTNIVSTRARGLPPGQGGWAPHPQLPDLYLINGGTSMAAPLVAGLVARLREYLRRVWRRRPSAALLKALIIHSAVYRPSPLEPDTGPYDMAQGWGHVRIDSVVLPESPRRVRMYERRKGLWTGQHITRWADVLSPEVPLKVTLVWTDAPGSPLAPRKLVNDLDLIVVAPDGRRYHGNQFRPPYDQAFDRVNNVEQVIIPTPVPGRYLLRVVAHNVPMGPQGFALVWSAHMR